MPRTIVIGDRSGPYLSFQGHVFPPRIPRSPRAARTQRPIGSPDRHLPLRSLSKLEPIETRHVSTADEPASHSHAWALQGPSVPHLSTVSAFRRLAYRTSLRAHSAPPIAQQRTRIVQARGMQCGFLPPSRSRRLLPAAAREHLLHPVHDPCTSRAPHGSADRLSRARPPGPGALPVAHAVCVAETLGAQVTRRAVISAVPVPSPTHPFPNSASAFANCDSESGKRKLETRRAVWQPARSTLRRRRRRSRRRRRRRSPAQPSSRHPQAGRRRFALNCALGWPLPIFLACSLHAACFGPDGRGSEACGGLVALGSGGFGFRLCEFRCGFP